MSEIQLTPRDRSDLRLLAWGAYAPLDAFTGEADHRSIVERMRVTSGELWPFPIAPALDDETAKGIKGASSVDLRDPDGALVARVVEPELYRTEPDADVVPLFGTDDPNHPGVAAVLEAGPWRLGGRIATDHDFALPAPFDHYPATPAAVKAIIAEHGWRTTVFFQTRNPIHRAHEYLTKCALETVDGLVIHPLVGETKDDDIPADVRLRCYETLLESYYPADRVLLAMFAAPMRYAGPREAVFHALVRANYGATHFIVGRDHAGVGDYYGTFAAQDLLRELGPAELNITPIFFDNAFYCGVCGQMATAKTCPHPPSDHVALSGTRVRKLLSDGEAPPAEYSRPEVAALLIQAYQAEQGVSR